MKPLDPMPTDHEKLIKRLDALAVDDRHEIHRVIRLALHDASKAIAALTAPTEGEWQPDGDMVERVADAIDAARSIRTNPDRPDSDREYAVKLAKAALTTAGIPSLKAKLEEVERERDEPKILMSARRIVATVAKTAFDHDAHDVEAILHGSIDSRLAIRAVVLALRPPSVRKVLCEQALESRP